MSVVLCLTASASHIKETLTLKNGWNGVYLEATPDVSSCSEFFKGLPVTKVMAYDGKGLDGMPLIDENGRDVLQPPVYYYTWNANAPDAGTLKSLVGGRCYLIYATNDCTKGFTGVPHPPHVFWRKTDDADSLMNFVGVSLSDQEPAVASIVTAKAYFGEGPYDGGKVYKVGGTDQSKPTMMQLLGASLNVANGTAYSVSASRSGLWPGVISVGSDRLLIAKGSGTLKVSNAGTAPRKFQMKMVSSEVSTEKFPPLLRQLPRTGIEDPGMTNVVAGDSWNVEMPFNGSVELLFKTDTANMATGETYAAVLQIEDLGASAMRVRVPVLVLDEKEKSENGLWVGAMALGEVSSIDGKMKPFPSAGIMSLNVIVHVDSNKTSRLLQRAIVAAESNNGTARVYRDLKDVPAGWTVGYRMFTGMMSLDAPLGTETSAGAFSTSNDLVFAWGVPERARDNPFRHAWHPDHDGLTADYARESPTGDDPLNYSYPVKPELWSVTNTLSFKFDEDCRSNVGGTKKGMVVWDVKGLVSTNTIRSTGQFQLRRVVKDVEFVK